MNNGLTAHAQIMAMLVAARVSWGGIDGMINNTFVVDTASILAKRILEESERAMPVPKPVGRMP